MFLKCKILDFHNWPLFNNFMNKYSETFWLNEWSRNSDCLLNLIEKWPLLWHYANLWSDFWGHTFLLNGLTQWWPTFLLFRAESLNFLILVYDHSYECDTHISIFVHLACTYWGNTSVLMWTWCCESENIFTSWPPIKMHKRTHTIEKTLR
jgi:hypothetical protein